MSAIKKGVILAGGSGTRLYPLTSSLNKHLWPVYDKPMLYYPLATLMGAGIRNICIVGSPRDIAAYRAVLENAGRWGIKISCREQSEPFGIAHALGCAADFLEGDGSAVILGDNFFCGEEFLYGNIRAFRGGALAFTQKTPEARRFGVMELDRDGKPVSVVEKPPVADSGLAITGLYLFDGAVADHCFAVGVAERGEMEITDVLARYMSAGELSAVVLGPKTGWMDMGTPESLLQAALVVRQAAQNDAALIGCPEKTAYKMGFISREEFGALISAMPPCEYRQNLLRAALRMAS